ncbi:MAG: hypothetical protein H6606_04515 [Flavobacteriales bacterium]|nr:hypothetical protein [Flavobacteriales bacterium]
MRIEFDLRNKYNTILSFVLAVASYSLSNSALAQIPKSNIEVNEFTYLDTIVYTRNQCRENPNFEFAFARFDSKVYYTYARNLQSRNVRIYSLDLLTYELDSICIKQKKRNIIPYAGRFAISQEYIVISGHRSFAVYKLDRTSGEYTLSSKEMDAKYYNLWLEGDVLKLTYCYNYYQDVDKAGFGLYNLKTNSWIVEKKLNVNGIYFTHFTPNQLLTFNGKNILALDPVNYAIVMYDSSGQQVDSFSRGLSDWKGLDHRVQNRLNDPKNNLPGKDVINYLNQHRLKIDRCQQIIGLSTDTFMVSYYRYDSVAKDVNYAVDYYSIDKGEIQLIKGEVEDISSMESNLTINNYFPSMHTYNAHLFNGKYLIVFRNVVPTEYWNKTIGEISRIEETYYMGNDGVLALFLFRMKI